LTLSQASANGDGPLFYLKETNDRLQLMAVTQSGGEVQTTQVGPSGLSAERSLTDVCRSLVRQGGGEEGSSTSRLRTIGIMMQDGDGALEFMTAAPDAATKTRQVAPAPSKPRVDHCFSLTAGELGPGAILRYGDHFQRVGENSLGPGGRVPAEAAYPVWDLAANQFQGHLFHKDGHLRLARSSDGKGQTLQSGVDTFGGLQPVGDDYVLLLDGQWKALGSAASNSDAMDSLTVGDELTSLTDDQSHLRKRRRMLNEPYMVVTTSDGGSALVAVDRSRDPQVRLIKHSADQLNLLEHGDDRVLVFAAEARRSGKLLLLDAASGEAMVEGPSVSAVGHAVPEYRLTDSALLYASSNNRLLASPVAGGTPELISGRGKVSIATPLTPSVAPYAVGFQPLGERLVYARDGAVYSLDPASAMAEGGRKKLGELPAGRNPRPDQLLRTG
jgi:hypothetical protein